MRHNLAKDPRWGASSPSFSGWCRLIRRLSAAMTQRAHACAYELCQPPVQYRLALLMAALLAVALTVFLVVSLRVQTSPIALGGLMGHGRTGGALWER